MPRLRARRRSPPETVADRLVLVWLPGRDAGWLAWRAEGNTFSNAACLASLDGVAFEP
jgi:hypothetical protein